MKMLLNQFINSFQKAITAEMDAIKRQMGPFEIEISGGRMLDESNESCSFYLFDIHTPSDKLVIQTECTLRCKSGEWLVTITDSSLKTVTIRCEQEISLGHGDYMLVIYPWFLYERLRLALAELAVSHDHYIDTAFLLFGKAAPYRQNKTLQLSHTKLNTSQKQAVQLCSDGSLAFIWGPPGTGKTTTLGHIVTELLAQGQRILITSTTNAAVDNALAKLATLPEAHPAFSKNEIIRIGQAGGETFGASLAEVTRRLNEDRAARQEYLRRRIQEARLQDKQCEHILNRLRSADDPRQLTLFAEIKSETLHRGDFGTVFSEKYINRLLNLSAKQQEKCILHRRHRLQNMVDLCQAMIAQYARERNSRELSAVKHARIILATMTNVYMSKLLQKEHFDTIIVEEAGMAILPTLFYCATLAKSKVIMVGDPQQLPPIVQSRDQYVFRAMGRNIFDVAAGSLTSDFTVMLDTQYRMHPVIGELVSTLFYGGRLHHGISVNALEGITRRKPYADKPLVVIDTDNRTICTTHDGTYSRFNEQTAQLCLKLAAEAVHDGVESVAIITPYAAQSRLLRQLLNGYPKEAPHVECRTVHRFQGGERDLVILDTVDTRPLSPGILLTGRSLQSPAENLINVSISRARGKLIIIADVAYFKHYAPKSFISEMLQLAKHTGTCIKISGQPPG